MLHRLFILLLVALSLACGKQKINKTLATTSPSVVLPPASTFVNPLLNSGPDPWVAQKDGFYYLLYTTSENITIRKTKTMSDVKSATPTVVWAPPAGAPNSFNLWAPELHYLGDRWYIYYTAGSKRGDLNTQRTFVLENVSADPTQGNWTDKGKIYNRAEDFWAIDGSILNYKDKNYFIWCGVPDTSYFIQCIYISEMADPVTLKGPRVKLSSPELAWERNGDPKVNEGPEALINPQGWLFLIYSASGCWTDEYALGMLSLNKGGDPMNASDWTKSQQPLFQKKPENAAYGPGHNGFFKSVDGKEDWIIYHANAQAGQGCLDFRSPRMQRFIWKADGTPDFGEPVKINVPLAKPAGE